MISPSEFFELNRSIIYFVYGLVFFILGFSIILQTRQSSRLDIARSLRWLAAFGITHGFHEWGDLFIPIQSVYLDSKTIHYLYMLHLILLAVSFSFLMEFGLRLITSRKGHSPHWITMASGGVWLVFAFGILPIFFSGNKEWGFSANALARYFIGFPGGLLAAYGLRKHTLERIQLLNVPQIVLNLQIVGIALGIYAVLGGLIPPPVPFFPGNIINRDVFIQVFGIPPLVFRSLIGIVIVIPLIRALEIFTLESDRRIEELEQNQIITAERERLARELHDGAIQKVYTAGLLVESASRLASPESELRVRLGKAVVVLNDSIADMRRNLAGLHLKSPTDEASLYDLLQQLAQNPNYTSMVQITISSEAMILKKLSSIRASHVYSIINEAMANIIRHAQARSVHISTQDNGQNLQIEIKDDGVGISATPKAGYGLRNMRDRARLLNGKLEIENNKGTKITLTIPWVDQ